MKLNKIKDRRGNRVWQLDLTIGLRRSRAKPAASAYLAFTETEIQLLDHLIPTSARRKTKPISHYLESVAKLGRYLARANDSPPDNMVLWRGFA